MSDTYGHVTRLSDSSVYDEICVNCLATDGRDDGRLKKSCPTPVGKGGMTLEEYSQKDKERVENTSIQ